MQHAHRGLQHGSQEELGSVQPSELRVLVVDSKSSSRQLATQLLRESQYQVCSDRGAADVSGTGKWLLGN